MAAPGGAAAALPNRRRERPRLVAYIAQNACQALVVGEIAPRSNFPANSSALRDLAMRDVRLKTALR